MKQQLPTVRHWLVLTLFFSLSLNIYFIYTNLNRNRVIKVVDGDSFELSDGRRIRLASIDAPELVNCKGIEAKNKLTDLIQGKIISLQKIALDDYGRILGNVSVNGKSVNLLLIEEGLAKFTSTTNPEFNKLKQAYNLAREKRLGIFSTDCLKELPINDCVIKGNIRNSKKTYHLQDCPTYRQTEINEAFGDRWFCTEEDAINEGFTKAAGCIL